MYLKELKLWNFRQFGAENHTNREEDLKVVFNEGLNLLVGENDSGKSTVVDAIKIVVLPYGQDYLRISPEDFFKDTKKLRIECEFTGFSLREAKNFPFYLTMNQEQTEPVPEDPEEYEEWLKKNVANLSLRVFVNAEIKGGEVGWYDIKAGNDDEGLSFRGEARELLRSMYLKPLRNAEKELTANPRSRLSQVLVQHRNFKETESKPHTLTEIFGEANEAIKKYFSGHHPSDTRGKETSDEIDTHLTKLFSTRIGKAAIFDVSAPKLEAVLQKLSLKLDEKQSGLGSLNILFIALELLLLKRSEFDGLKLGVIEEVEAHLHTQAQMRALSYLQNLSKIDEEEPIQMILTTHSTHIASEVNLKNLILIKKRAFRMGDADTKLEKSDYKFLERFLDATKANLFFAEGVIIVEGDAENLLVPALAKLIDRDLTDYGVSIVNVGHCGLHRYARIFLRQDSNRPLELPVACIKDNDVQYESARNVFEMPTQNMDEKRASHKSGDEQNVASFVSPNWTLEFDIALDPKLREEFYRAVLYAKKAAGAKDHIFINDNKKSEANDFLQKEIAKWESIKETAKDYQIAHEIYKDCRENKTLTAQFYAEYLEQLLEEKDFLQKEIAKWESIKETAKDHQMASKHLEKLSEEKDMNSKKIDNVVNSPKLAYIFDAIRYVTAPLSP